jgi:hypothetical protein
VLSLRVSRDKRGYDYIYLLLEGRRRGRVENRLLYCGRWPTPCRVGLRPFDDETRVRLEEAHPDVAFDWPALLKTLQAALGVSRPATAGPPPPPLRSRRQPPAAPPYGGRPGQPRQPGGPSTPRPTEPIERIEPTEEVDEMPEVEPDYAPGEVVLVSAEIEERESVYVAPEFEPVDETDRAYAAAIDLELVTDEIVQVPMSEAERQPTGAEGPHVFVEPGGTAAFAADAGDDDAEPPPQSAESVGAPGAPGDPNRPRRRRRRRGGRGRGKPPDVRQNSD